jgi:hypothetical protein
MQLNSPIKSINGAHPLSLLLHFIPVTPLISSEPSKILGKDHPHIQDDS